MNFFIHVMCYSRSIYKKLGEIPLQVAKGPYFEEKNVYNSYNFEIPYFKLSRLGGPGSHFQSCHK